MWQTLERKARFIGQVIHGRLDTRDIADIGETALSFSEVKALAAGNPLLIDKTEADAELARLQRAERAHYRSQDALEHAIRRHQADIQALTRLAADLGIAISRRHDTRGDAFTMTVGGRQHSKRAEAGQHLKELLQREAAELDGVRTRAAHPGDLGGFPLIATAERSLGKTTVSVIFDGIPAATVQMPAGELPATGPAGLISRLENRLYSLEERKKDATAGIERASREITHAQESLGRPFPQAAQLAAARQRARDIDEELDRMAAPEHPHNPPAAPGGSRRADDTGKTSQAGTGIGQAARARPPQPSREDGVNHAASRDEITANNRRWPAAVPVRRDVREAKAHAPDVSGGTAPLRASRTQRTHSAEARRSADEPPTTWHSRSLHEAESLDATSPAAIADTWRDDLTASGPPAWEPRSIQGYRANLDPREINDAQAYGHAINDREVGGPEAGR